MGNLWDKLAINYDANTARNFKKANQSVINYTKQYCQRSDNLLDLGCGTGMIISDLADYVKSIDAIDSSPAMIELARQKKATQGITNITFTVSNIQDFNFGKAKYHIVTAFNLLLYLNNHQRVLESIYACLPAGGYFISVTDCLGEKKVIAFILKCLSKVGLVPSAKCFTISSLKNNIESAGFNIVFSKNVHSGIPNYYIVAQKL